MKTSIATVSLSGDLQEKLSAIAKAGFDGVEIFELDFISYDGAPRELGALVREHGLRSVGGQAACGGVHAGSPEARASASALRSILPLALRGSAPLRGSKRAGTM